MSAVPGWWTQWGRRLTRLGVASVLLVGGGISSRAQTFSVEVGGPNWDFLGPNQPLHGDALLLPTVHALPIPLGPFNRLVNGTGANGLDVDGFSFGYDNSSGALNTSNPTSVFFAVTRTSQGLSGSGVNREATENFGRLMEMPPVLPGLPAANRSQASDIYIATNAFPSNLTLHDDDGFYDGGITPNPAPGVPLGLPNLTSGGRDAIDGISMQDTGPGLGTIGLGSIYFSLTAASATGGVSGADILRGPQANGFAGSASIYAAATNLGLTASDEITSLVVVDADGDPTGFNAAGGDAVFFSLTAASPSLAAVPVVRPLNGNLAVPADVIRADASGFSVAARAEDIGLGIAPGSDELNGLDLLFDVGAPPTAGFTNSPPSGCAPWTVSFTNTSTAGGAPIVSWDWTFGDGGTSTNQNPIHEYDLPGLYTVALTVTDGGGLMNTITRSNLVEATGPTVSFANDVSAIAVGQSVGFTDLTVPDATITNWSWDFGDGSGSNLQNPTHTYTNAGVFDVSLTVSDADGCSRAAVSNALITVSLPELILAEKTAVLLNDADGDGKISPGDTVRYTISVTNTGDVEATEVTLTDMVDTNTLMLVPGSVNAPPVALGDTYATTAGVPLVVSAPGVLMNDSDPDSGPDPISVGSADTNSVGGGAVSVAADGSFTYTPAAGFSGTDTFGYTVTDGAGLDGATVSIDVAEVADLSVSKSDDVDPIGEGELLTYTIIVSNAGPTTASEVTVTDTLPGSVTLTMASGGIFACSNPAPGVVMCTGGPIAAGATATITIPVTADAVGTITNSVSVSTTAIDTNAANDTAMEETVVEIGNTAPVATNDSYNVIGNVGLDVPEGSGVLANDGDPEMDMLTVTMATGGLGSVLVDADGSFLYQPPRGYTGPDSFTYVVSDGSLTDTGTVNLTVSDLVWFVDNGAAGSNEGTLANPYNSLASFRTANGAGGVNPAAGDCIFIFDDAVDYTGGLPLLNNQAVVGQGTTQDVAVACGLPPTPHSPFPTTGGGLKPTIVNAAGVGITLASGNTVRGLDVQSSAAEGMAGSAVGSLSISAVSVSSSVGGVDLSNGALDVSFDAISSSGSDNGIRLVNTTGRFTVTGDGGTAQNNAGGVIQNTSADGISLQNAQNITLNQMTIDNTGNNGIGGREVQNLTLTACVLEDTGNSTDEAALAFNTETAGAGNDQNITGLLRLDNTDITRFLDIGLHIYQDTGVVTVEVVNASDFTDGADVTGGGADSGFGIYIETEGAAGALLTVDGSTFDDIESNIVRFEGGGSAAQDVNVLNCVSTDGGGADNFPNGGGIEVLVTDNQSITFDIQGNQLLDIPGDGIIVAGTTGGGNAEGRIGGPLASQGNTIISDPLRIVADAITLNLEGVQSGTPNVWTVLIQNNLIGQDARTSPGNTTGVGDDGIFVRLSDTLHNSNVTVEDNVIRVVDPDLINTGGEGIDFFLDADGVTGGAPTLNARVANNTIISVGTGNQAIEVDTRDTFSACVRVVGNNNGTTGTLPGVIEMDAQGSSVIQVPQSSAAVVASDNDGTTSNLTGVQFNINCSTPTLPGNP